MENTYLFVAGGIIAVVIAVAAFFFLRRSSVASAAASSKTSFLTYSPDPETVAGAVSASKLWDEEGLPRMNRMGQVHRLTFGPDNYQLRQTMEGLRRHCLIPVDLAKGEASVADTRQQLLSHPKRYAAQLAELASADEKEWLRNALLAVFLERCLVNPPTAYATPGNALMAPIEAQCPQLAALLAQVLKTPHNAAADAKAFNAALKAEDRRSRFVATSALHLLAFPREGAPVSAKVKDMLASIDLDAVLGCADVDPWAYGTFERLSQLRAAAGEASPTVADIAENAVSRGFAAAYATFLISPTAYPPPARPVPTAAVVELIVAAMQSDMTAPVVDHVLSTALSTADASPALFATTSRLLGAAGDGFAHKGLKSTAAVLAKNVAKVSGGAAEVDETSLAASEARVTSLAAVPPATVEVPAPQQPELNYPGLHQEEEQPPIGSFAEVAAANAPSAAGVEQSEQATIDGEQYGDASA